MWPGTLGSRSNTGISDAPVDDSHVLGAGAGAGDSPAQPEQPMFNEVTGDPLNDAARAALAGMSPAALAARAAALAARAAA